jgi:hypothetical protein
MRKKRRLLYELELARYKANRSSCSSDTLMKKLLEASPEDMRVPVEIHLLNTRTERPGEFPPADIVDQLMALDEGM